MRGLYILNSAGDPEPTEDTLAWGRWFEQSDRRIALDLIGDLVVSTVFLGLDHGLGVGAPILFETMIFRNGRSEELYSDRFSTRADAIEGHARASEIARSGCWAARSAMDRRGA